VKLIHLNHSKDLSRVLINTIMNFGFTTNAVNSLICVLYLVTVATVLTV
jgi:hypothetical protein